MADSPAHLRPRRQSGSQSQERADGQMPVLMQRTHSSAIDPTAFSFARPANPRSSFSLRAPPNPLPINPAIVREVGGFNARSKQDRPVSPFVVMEPRSGQPLVDSKLQHPEQGPADTVSSHCQHNDSPMNTELVVPTLDENANPAGINTKNIQTSTLDHQNMLLDTHFRSDTAMTADSAAYGALVPSAVCPTSPGSVHSIEQTAGLAAQKPPPSPPPACTKDRSRVTKIRPQNRKRSQVRRQMSNTSNQGGTQQLTEDKLFELLIGRIKQREENEAVNASLQRQLKAQNLQLQQECQELHNQLEAYHAKLQKSVAETKVSQSQIGDWKAKIRNFKHVVNELGNDYDALRDDNGRIKEMALSLEEDKTKLMQAIDEMKAQIARAEEKNEFQQAKISEDEKCIAVLTNDLENSGAREKDVQAQLSYERKRTSTLESYIQSHSRSHAKQLDIMREQQGKFLYKLESGLESITNGSSEHQDAVLEKFTVMSEEFRSSIHSLAQNCSTEATKIHDFTEVAHDTIASLTILSAQLTEDVQSNNKTSTDLANAVRKDLEKIEGQFDCESPLFKELHGCVTSHVCLNEKFGRVEPILYQLNTSVKSLTNTEGSLIQDLKSFGERLTEAQIPSSNPVLEMELSSKFAENTQLQLRIHDISSEMDDLRKRLCGAETENQTLHRCVTDGTAKQQAIEERNQSLEGENLALRAEIKSTEQRVRQEHNERSTVLMGQMKTRHENELQALQKQKDDMKHVFDGNTAQQITSTEKRIREEVEREKAALIDQLKVQHGLELQTLQKKKNDMEHASAELMFQQISDTEKRTRQEVEKEYAALMDKLKGQHELELQTLQKERDDTENVSAEITAKLSGVQDSLNEAKKIADAQRQERDLLFQESGQQIEQLRNTCSEYSVRLDAQVNEIQRYQEQEVASRLENVALREQLKRAKEKVHDLEKQMTSKLEVQDLHKSPVKNIVSFSAIERQLSPLRANSPYNDPADFSMLFMSDEFPTTPFGDSKSNQPPQAAPKISQGKEEELVKQDTGNMFDLREVDTPKPKRKGVNFKSPQPEKKTKKLGIAQETSGHVEGEPEGPKKISKHIHKWTYSRVQSSATEIQQEQSTVPAAERRASPKALVSANNANDTRGRANTRSRGRRRSRGERYNARFGQEC